MAERGVEHAAVTPITPPGLGVVAAFAYPGPRRCAIEIRVLGVEAEQHVHAIAGETHRRFEIARRRDVQLRRGGAPRRGGERVELLDDRPARTEYARRGMRGVFDLEDAEAALGERHAVAEQRRENR